MIVMRVETRPFPVIVVSANRCAEVRRMKTEGKGVLAYVLATCFDPRCARCFKLR